MGGVAVNEGTPCVASYCRPCGSDTHYTFFDTRGEWETRYAESFKN